MKHLLHFIILMIPTTLLFSQGGVGISELGSAPSSSSILDVSSDSKGILIPRISLTSTTDNTTIINGNIVSLLVYNKSSIADIVPGYYYWDGSVWKTIGGGDDADANPNNEIQDLQLIGNNLTITNNGSPTSIDLSQYLDNTTDHDWYEVGGTNAPDNINDAIFTQGMVGIGTTTPTHKLSVIEAGNDNGIYISSNGNGGEISWHDNTHFSITNGRTLNTTISTPHYGISSPRTPLAAETWLSGSEGVALYTDGKERVFVSPSGRVGFGTSIPLSNLHVTSNVPALRLTEADGAPNEKDWLIIANANELVIGGRNDANSGGGNYFSFDRIGQQINSFYGNESGNKWFEIDNASKRVGIGTLDPKKPLHIIGEDGPLTANPPIYAKDYLVIENDHNCNMALGMKAGRSGAYKFYIEGSTTAEAMLAYTSNDQTLYLHNNGTDVLNITATGLVGIGTTNPTEVLDVSGNVEANAYLISSDKRFKKNIETLNNATEIIKNINPVSYNFKVKEFDEKKFDERKHYGVLAQEIEQVLPDLVFTDNDGYKSVNYSEIISILIKSNQEQQKQIEQQQHQINSLIKRIENQ